MESMQPILEETFIAFATMTMLDMDTEFDPIDDSGKAWIQEHALDLAKGIDETTTDKLRVQLEEAMSQGEGIEKIARRIRQVFEEASVYRSAMIARTETTNAANMGSLSAAKRGGCQTKTWYTAMDERVCPYCGILHGKTIGIDDVFPGDILGPSRHPNCRCTLLFSFDEVG